jgi:hypothetical protein
MQSFHDYTGVIHIHSAYSYDGRTTVPDIVADAAAAGLDFVMLTDHETIQARTDGLEGWHGRVLLVVGQETAPRFNHYLSFGIDVPLPLPSPDAGVSPQALIDEVRARGGIGFIAHPDHEGAPLFLVKPYPWLDWSVAGFTGMSVWDFMTDWQGSLRGLARSLVSYCFPAFVLRGPKRETLERWDRLNRTGRVVGIGELDNHDTVKKVWGMSFSIFPFAKALRFVRTHVLTERPLSGGKEDGAILLDALRRGRAFFSQEYFHRAAGFTFTVAGNGASATMGDAFVLRTEALLRVHLPARGRIRIIRNGSLVHETVGEDLAIPLCRAGVFRVECARRTWGRYRPWIFSNPIYVTETHRRTGEIS